MTQKELFRKQFHCWAAVAHTFSPIRQRHAVRGQPGLQSRSQNNQSCYKDKPCLEIPPPQKKGGRGGREGGRTSFIQCKEF